MNPYRIITLIPIVSLVLGHSVIAEEPERPDAVVSPFSGHGDMIHSHEPRGERLSWEILPPLSMSEQFTPGDSEKRSNVTKVERLIEGDLSGMLDESVRSSRVSKLGDDSSQQNSARIHRTPIKHVECQVPLMPEHADAVGQPHEAATTGMSPSPSCDAVRGHDVSDRVSALEQSIEQVETSQRTARAAAGVLGIALLGVVLTHLCRHWLSGDPQSSFGDTEAAGRMAKDVPHTAKHTDSGQRGSSGIPRINGQESRTQTTVDAVVAPSSAANLAAGNLQGSDVRPPAVPDTVEQHLPDTQHILDDRQEIPEPVDAVRSLIHSMNDLQPPNELSLADEAWCAGFSRHIGPRDNQEDYVLAFQVGSIRVCLLADGAGGHPLGEYASYHGLMGAAASVARTLGFAPEDRKLELEKTARQAIHDASFAIAIHAASTGVPQRSSLRSTLIVLLATDEEFAWANLGDGGGWTIRATPRDYDSFLVPAKGEEQHHLTSSLGPAIHGDITSGTKPWGDTDFLAIASDGVADIIDTAPFFDACLATCLQSQGSFSEATEAMLHLLVESPDVTDNVSIGFVGRRRKPVLAV